MANLEIQTTFNEDDISEMFENVIIENVYEGE
jgi:hypothetical protein